MSIIRRLWLTACCVSAAICWSVTGAAQDVTTLARTAGAQLQEASRALDAAQTARDRVQALTETVAAYEVGLAAMRDGLRRASLRETQLKAQLAARDAEVGALLGTLQSIAPSPTPQAFLHPKGPTGTARAGMILAELTPVLNTRAARLRRDLADVQALQDLQTHATAQLQNGLREVQKARTALSQAMAQRVDLPRHFTEDPVRTAILISSAETLDAFASGLSDIGPSSPFENLPNLDALRGNLPWPVRGLVLREANAPDAAGIVRPGLLRATRPGALVTSPTAATVRYQGPLLNLGEVVILEPGADTLMILAGLAEAFVTMGEVVAAGTPIGLMGGLSATGAKNDLSLNGDRAGTARTETLYIEVRQENAPQDPQTWFRPEEDG